MNSDFIVIILLLIAYIGLCLIIIRKDVNESKKVKQSDNARISHDLEYAIRHIGVENTFTPNYVFKFTEEDKEGLKSIGYISCNTTEFYTKYYGKHCPMPCIASINDVNLVFVYSPETKTFTRTDFVLTKDGTLKSINS